MKEEIEELTDDKLKEKINEFIEKVRDEGFITKIADGEEEQIIEGVSHGRGEDTKYTYRGLRLLTGDRASPPRNYYYLGFLNNNEKRGDGGYPYISVKPGQNIQIDLFPPRKNDFKLEFNASDLMNKIIYKIDELILENNRKVKGTDMQKKVDEAGKILKTFKQIILSGAPGTGKTYTAKKLALKMLDIGEENKVKYQFSKITDYSNGAWDIVQLHPNYGYEDFVQGITAKTGNDGKISYEVEKKIFALMAEKAESNPKQSFILIVDEINRANLPSVLGELIYALEYRNEPIKLMYGGELEIPDNLYIIGTMNTADRSIGHIDYAIRRRFPFIACHPDESAIKSDLGKKLFHAVSELFKSENISPEFDLNDIQIGHSYFMYEDKDKTNEEEEDKDKTNEEEEEKIKMKLEYQVIPLLREYQKDGLIVSLEELEKTIKELEEIKNDATETK